jgi:hypothetical protein
MSPLDDYKRSIDSCGPGIDELIQSCASITNRALSYRPLLVVSSGKINKLKLPQQHQCYDHGSISDVFGTERNTKKVNLTNYQKRTSQRNNQQELLNECLRAQQEYLLLLRLKSSRGTAKIFQEKNENKATIRSEALIARKNQVSRALEQSKALALYRQQIDELHLACQKARERNTDLFQELYRKKYGSNEIQHKKDPPSENGQKTIDDKLKRENDLLKAIIADLIAGCGLDWFQNKKIGQIFENAVQ